MEVMMMKKMEMNIQFNLISPSDLPIVFL